MKIVVVDDNPSLRAVLRSLCEREGHQILAEFGDGVGLIEYVARHRPDVVCLDYNLPGTNGLDLLKQMDVSVNQVDVVMITGSDDPELKGQVADAGATGFIHKPFEQMQVIKELNDIEQTRRIAARASGAAESPPAAAVTATPEKTIGVIPRTAVIVDDSASVRLLLKGILEDLGIKIIGVATNGSEGVKVVQKMHPALVCLDVDMPGMTGIEALPEIRAASPQSKVVMVTGNAGRSIVEAAISGGAKGYFLKPIRPATIEEFVRKLINAKWV